MDTRRPSLLIAAPATNVSRRTLLRAGGCALSLPIAARWGTATAQEALPAVTGEFVGAVDRGASHHSAEIFVAVVLDAPDLTSGVSPVRAYLCDGNSVSEWFNGEFSGDRFTLATDAGATIEAVVTAARVGGSLTLADGAQYRFTAARTAGRGGLYRPYLRDDLSAYGVSASGVAFDQRVSGDVATGTFLFPDGSLEDFEIPVITLPDEAVHVRLIVQDGPDMHMRGSSFQPANVQVTQSRTQPVQQVQAPRTQFFCPCID